MIKMVVFDMAGTTVDEQNVVYRTLRETIQSTGVEVSQEEVNRIGAGKEKQQAIEDILQEHGTHQHYDIDDLYNEFLGRLTNAYASLEVKPILGAENLFDALRANGIKIVLNTGYDRSTAESLIKKLKWEIGDTIDGMVTASEVARSRPHPDMITKAQADFKINDPANVLKIGDSAIDIQEGKNAGCGTTVGITTGAQPRELLRTANPTHIIDSLEELEEIILGKR